MKPSELNPCPHPVLLVLSGPSGVGKDYIIANLRRTTEASGLTTIVTNTTRPMRQGESQDTDYHFVSLAEFQQLIATGGLLEYASVYGNWYGVPKAPVRAALAAGRDVLIKVDVQGARTIKQALPGAVLIFVAPPSMADLADRLARRNTESPGQLERRLKTAEAEIQEMPNFDYVITNHEGRASEVIAGLEAIILAEKLRVNPRECRI